jgi:predicted house-cleaning noncanonical NTP pyrophosphatase (MazG superfamily)
MRKFEFKKIIRSKGISNIKEMGAKPIVTDLDDEGYIKALYGQLKGEVEEVIDAKEENIAEEIGDVYEVLEAIIKFWKLDKSKIIAMQEVKREEKGDFSDKRFVKFVEVPDDYPWIDYYLKNADRYPEITDTN